MTEPHAMTEPDERLPAAGAAVPAGPAIGHDPEAAEEYAESVGIDPSPDEIRHYQELLGDVPREPPEEGP